MGRVERTRKVYGQGRSFFRERLTSPEVSPFTLLSGPGCIAVLPLIFRGREGWVMPVGTVKWFDVKKGFGFIHGPEGEKDIFVHYSVIETEGFKTLRDGDTVEYEVLDSVRGPHASHVRLLTQDQPKPVE